MKNVMTHNFDDIIKFEDFYLHNRKIISKYFGL